MSIGKNIKTLRLKEQLSQEDLAKALGYKSYTTITKWESEVSEPTLKMTTQLADFFKVSVNELCYMDFEHPSSPTSKGISIPVVGKVVAGIPVEAFEDILDYEEISVEMASTGEFFALQLKGTSMEPRMYEGDVVIVKMQSDVENGEIAIVIVNGDEATCKKIIKEENGIKLESLNPHFPPIFYSTEDIENKPLRIIGKVVELRGKF